MSDKVNLKDININELKIFDLTSWQPILLASFVVWLLTCNQTCSDIILSYKNNIAVLGIVIYFICLAYAIYKKKSAKTIIGIILLGGLLIRAYYTLAAPYGITKHDLGNFTGLNSGEIGAGNAGYVDYIFKKGHLFDFDPRTKWSFYQPPFFYIVAAVVLKITTIFNVAEPLCYESVQVVTLFFSSLTVWTCYRIIKEFPISDKLVVVAIAFLSFHPFFSIMSVTLTNDSAAMYFMALAVWYTIRWQKSPTIKNIIVIALAVGTAMASKLNAAVISFGIGIVFLHVFLNNRKELKKYILQFVIFILICAPIGLYNPVRNYVKFDVPFSFIQKLGSNNPQFIQNSTLLSRLLLPSFEQMSYAFPNFNTKVERNIWIQAIRTSLFDELAPDVGSSLFDATSLVFLWLAVVLAVFMNIAFVWHVIRDFTIKQELQIFMLFMSVEYVTMLISYAKFCMSAPFICTMNYRYIPICLLFPLICTALWLQNRQDKKMGRFGVIMKNVLVGGMVCFSVLAVIININLIALSGTLL